MSRLHLLFRLLRSEGIRSVLIRSLSWIDRWRRRLARSGSRVPAAELVALEQWAAETHGGGSPNLPEGSFAGLARELGEADRRRVLHLTSSDPRWNGGGIDHHLRMLAPALSAAGWSSAVAWVRAGRLELLWDGRSDLLWTFDLSRLGDDLDSALCRALDVVIAALGIEVLHAHDLRAFDRSWLVRLTTPLVVSLHDFHLFCRRPHLIEALSLDFCGYSRDAERCRRCLDAGGEAPSAEGGDPQASWREESARLLARADALAAPSAFMLRTVGELFPDSTVAAKAKLVEHERSLPWPDSRRPPLRAPDESGGTRVVFVGQFHWVKGSRVFLQIVEALAEDRRFSFAVVGEVIDHWALDRARKVARVETTGRYRRSQLPRRLCPDTDVVAFTSLAPESSSYTLTEVLSLGLAVFAFDRGAVAERLRRLDRADFLVDPADGASGFVRGLESLVGGVLEWPEPTAETPRSAEEMARNVVTVYEQVLAGRESGSPERSTIPDL